MKVIAMTISLTRSLWREVTALLSAHMKQTSHASSERTACGFGAMLFLSRTLWLLSLEKPLLDKWLFGDSAGPAGVGPSPVALSSTQQIVSAFEIANAKCDGLVTLSEAKEVRVSLPVVGE